jgi:L-ribulose-5-phosphate 3-epimerase
MAFQVSRRAFLTGMGTLAATMTFPSKSHGAEFALPGPDLSKSPFRIAVINDEIGQDFGRVCEIASRQFGMRWMELRGMWNKNILNLDSHEIAAAQQILKNNQLRVTDIASPLFKVDWPGAPKSKYSEQGDQFNAAFRFEQQSQVLNRSIELARIFGTDRVRCFDFWRLDDQGPYRAAIDQTLQDAAEHAGKAGVTLLLENEPSCNSGTGAEAARTLRAVKSRNLMLNWDPGNAAARGENPFPDGYHLLPKDRIGHCHCKDVIRKHDGYDWAAMGQGIIDWVGQFKALRNDGYHYAVSLETHWRGAETAEASTAQSWAGMRRELQEAGAL